MPIMDYHAKNHTMSKTWLSILTALLLVNLSVGVMLARRAILGRAIDGPQGGASWNIQLVVAGQAKDSMKPRSLTLALPPDFRRQHIIEGKPSQGAINNSVQHEQRRELHWQAPAKSGTGFRFSVSFRAILGMREPSGAMKKLTQRFHARPSPASLTSSEKIQSEDKLIVEQSQSLVDAGSGPLPKARSLFEFVSRLEFEPTFEEHSAIDTLAMRGGDPLGKSRLLVALCRSQGIPARMVTGLILSGDRSQDIHYWVEAYIHEDWLPMCATYHFFGHSEIPGNYLVVHFGDERWIRGQNVRFAYSFLAQPAESELSVGKESNSSKLKVFLQKLSLHSLAPQEQALVKFLLLLPPAALIVCFFRVVVGLPTFGTYGPALLGLSFLDWSTLPWGIAAFVIIVMVGWGLRRILNHYRLLMVPRTAALLTLIVIFLVVVTVITSQLGIPLTNYLALFPLVILTHMVERFWTVEAEDGTSNSFKTLIGTLIVIVSVSLSMAPKIVTTVLFRYPESLGIILAISLLLGRYTGYRLSELRRFRDLANSSSG